MAGVAAQRRPVSSRSPVGQQQTYGRLAMNRLLESRFQRKHGGAHSVLHALALRMKYMAATS